MPDGEDVVDDAVDGYEILEKLAALPVSTWNYQWDPPSTRHLGPMAQDFKAAFGLGDSDTSISFIDANGVNVVAIQALYRKLQALEARVAELEGHADASPHARSPEEHR